MAGVALRAAHVWRNPCRYDRTRIRLQPSPALDEGSHHGVLEFVGNNRQPLGAGSQLRCAKLRCHQIHCVIRLWCDRLSNVLLRRVRLCRSACLRHRRPHLPVGRLLSPAQIVTASIPLARATPRHRFAEKRWPRPSLISFSANIQNDTEARLAAHHALVSFGRSFEWKHFVHRMHATQRAKAQRVLRIDCGSGVPPFDGPRASNEQDRIDG